MTVYIPILLLYIPVAVVIWCMIGWAIRFAIFVIFPGMSLGLPRSTMRMMVWSGPLLIAWVLGLVWDYLRARRARGNR